MAEVLQRFGKVSAKLRTLVTSEAIEQGHMVMLKWDFIKRYLFLQLTYIQMLCNLKAQNIKERHKFSKGHLMFYTR